MAQDSTEIIKDYSQYGEQKLILEFFDEHRDAPRYCVDAGAYEGEIGSNSRALFLRGWAGVVIEPDPRSFARLNVLYEGRKDVARLRRALSDRVGLRRMRFCKGPPGTKPEDEWQYAQVNTLSERFANAYVKEHNYRYRSSFVVTTTIKRALRKVMAPRDIGFMSIDCEAEDMIIVQSLDFDEHRPRLLCIECGEDQPETRGRFASIVGRHGYRYCGQTLANAFFALESLTQSLTQK